MKFKNKLNDEVREFTEAEISMMMDRDDWEVVVEKKKAKKKKKKK
tara:strand:+ start:497 stop:631 length:135 start_codon:yes stop_codon:yes gene_type:complete